MRNNQISLINHPTVIKAEQDPKFAEEHKDELNSLIAQQSKLAQAGGMDEDKANALNAPYHLAVGQGLRQFLKTQLVAGLDAQAQVSATQPTGVAVNTGAGGATISTNEYSANPLGTALTGTAYKKVLAPGEQDTYVGPDPAGNSIYSHRNEQTGAIENISVPSTKAPTAKQPITPQQIPANETAASRQELINRKTTIDASASGIGTDQYVNNQLTKLLDEDHTFSATGSNAARVASIFSNIGMPLGDDLASRTNTITHYLALNNQANEKAMGVSTDAGRAVNDVATGSASQDTKSLRTAIKNNAATKTALQWFQQGNDQAVKNKDIYAQREFQNEWSKTYNQYGPIAMRLHNAVANHDVKERDEIYHELGIKKDKNNNYEPKKSIEYQQVLFTGRNLEKLQQKGHL